MSCIGGERIDLQHGQKCRGLAHFFQRRNADDVAAATGEGRHALEDCTHPGDRQERLRYSANFTESKPAESIQADARCYRAAGTAISRRKFRSRRSKCGRPEWLPYFQPVHGLSLRHER